MNLPDFCHKYNISLDDRTHAVSSYALKKMSHSKNQHHDVEHVYRMFDDLSHLLDINPKLLKKINFQVLLPAICWHDVWISRRQTNGFLELLWHQFLEGRGSANLFSLYAKEIIPPSLVDQIAYCIRKHSSIQFLPTFNLEAKILADLDKLEMWNICRFLDKDKTMVSKKSLYSKYLVRAYYKYSWYAGLSFNELNPRFSVLKKNYLSKLIDD